MKQTIIVSNRLPVSVRKGEKGIEVYPSSGGLATGLSSYANRKGNLWIGWPGLVSDDLTEAEKRQISRTLLKYNCQPVFLTKKQVDEFYSGYSNSILWPVFHVLEADYDHQERNWKTYRAVNNLFTEAVLSLSEPGCTIWVHDYQLMLVPKMLREHRPNDSIGFFLHTPFPPAKHFADLKESGPLIRGLLGADLIGFHTKKYVDKFIEATGLLTGAAPIKDGLALKERSIRVADFPIGIDYVKFAEATKLAESKRELAKMRRKYKDRKIILTVDRLDPTKGFIGRLKAFRTFLKESPQLIGNVHMVMLAVPSRGDVAAYQKLRKDVEALVKQINKQYGYPGWQPIDYMHKSVDFPTLSALYQLADVAFVAPVRDGMNLVAKEYIASQGRKKGMLILSETAGASQELKDALLVNPSQQQSLVSALKRAIKMPRTELKTRVDAMQKVISENTIYDWAGDFMNTLRQPVPIQQTPSLNDLRTKNLVLNYQNSLSRLLVFDYDGVLSPFKGHPADAAPSDEIVSLLNKLAKDKKNTVVVVSGRSKTDLMDWLGDLPITLIAEHGATIRKAGNKTWSPVADSSRSWKRLLLPVLEKHSAKTPGSFVEEKDNSLVWHYRNARPYYAQKGVATLRHSLAPFVRQHGLKLHLGNKIIEIKHPNINKGFALTKLQTKPFDFILCLGDDFTDEDMFKTLPRRAYTIKVGPGKTAARYRIKNVGEVQDLLRNL